MNMHDGDIAGTYDALVFEDVDLGVKVAAALHLRPDVTKRQ